MNLEECTEIIISLTADRPLTTVVLDALDECDEETRPDLLEAIAEILQCSTNLVKMFITSRDDHDIFCQLTEYPTLEIQANKNHEVDNLMKTKTTTFSKI